MGAGVGLLIELPEAAVLFVDEVDEDDAGCADDGQTGEYDQRHRPSDADCDGEPAGKHSEEVEHASDLLASCPLVGEGISVELRGEFELILLIEPSDILPEKAFHISLSALDGESLAEDGPGGEGDPGGE